MSHPSTRIYSHAELTLANGSKVKTSPGAKSFVSSVNASELIAIAEDGTVYRDLADFVVVTVDGERDGVADRPDGCPRTPEDTCPFELHQDYVRRMAPYRAKILARNRAANAHRN